MRKIPTTVANEKKVDILTKIIKNEDVGTVFYPLNLIPNKNIK